MVITFTSFSVIPIPAGLVLPVGDLEVITSGTASRGAATSAPVHCWGAAVQELKIKDAMMVIATKSEKEAICLTLFLFRFLFFGIFPN